MPKPLTDKQRAVLNFIIKFKDEHTGCSPSYLEICANFGYSSNKSAWQHLEALSRKGYIRRPFGKVRAITIIKPKLETVVIAGMIIEVGFVDEGRTITRVGRRCK